MSRLIDADALNKRLQAQIGSPEGDAKLMEINQCIIEAPTIDAIPVSWLRAMRLEHPEIDMERLYDAVTSTVLALWENKQEGR